MCGRVITTRKCDLIFTGSVPFRKYALHDAAVIVPAVATRRVVENEFSNVVPGATDKP